MLDNNIRYLQLAFNQDLGTAMNALPRITRDPRILVEAGTPFIKREGAHGIATLARRWPAIERILGPGLVPARCCLSA